MNSKGSTRALILPVLLLVGCVAAPPSATQPPRAGGTLRVGYGSQVGTLDPNKWNASYDVGLGRQIYDALVAWDGAQQRAIPWLAESWSVSSDGRTYAFKLKSGVKFQDGTPFDAAAAKANLERLSPQAVSISGIVRDIALNLDSVSAPDNVTVIVQLKAPSASFLESLEFVPMLSPAAFQHWGDEYGQHPMGTGAFRIAEWVADDHLLLERNPDYAWPPADDPNPGAAYFDSILLKFITDPPARLVSLESGDADLITSVPLQDVARLAGDDRFQILKGPSVGMPLVLFLNVSVAPLTDRDVRVALQLALDRASLIQTGGFGQPGPPSGLLTSSTRCFSTGFSSVFPYDPAQARQLLDQSGWMAGPDGLRSKAGAPLAFDLVFYPDYANLASTIQAQLRDIGVQVRLRMMNVVGGGSFIRAGQADTFIVAQLGGGPSVLNAALHTRMTGASLESASIVRDSESDRLLDQAAAEPDPSRQCQWYDQFQQRYLETGAAYPIWENTLPLVLHSNVDGGRLWARNPILPLLQELSLAR